jgi:hypothetical protein
MAKEQLRKSKQKLNLTNFAKLVTIGNRLKRDKNKHTSARLLEFKHIKSNIVEEKLAQNR